jgi:hypothetical protein
MADYGILYEQEVGKWLKTSGISNGVTAQSTSDNPDIIIRSSGIDAGVELKNQITAAGSLVMKFDHTKQLWDFGDADKPEKRLIVALGKRHNLLEEMNVRGNYGINWRKNKPMMQIKPNGSKLFLNNLTERAAYEIDIANFPYKKEIRFEIQAEEISNYYVAKGCSYINVGSYGFYTLGKRDDLRINDRLTMLGLPPVEDFNSMATSCQYRVRCQLKENPRYQFAATLEINILKKGTYDLAPIRKGTKYLVDRTQQSSHDLIRAFKINK